MATGPEHYLSAEAILLRLRTVEAGDVGEPGLIGEAQVHATLALASAVDTLAVYLGMAGEPSAASGEPS